MNEILVYADNAYKIFTIIYWYNLVLPSKLIISLSFVDKEFATKAVLGYIGTN